MGFIAKLQILLFGAVSLFCLMWATMVYTQKMDFVTPKDAGSSEGGKAQPGKAKVTNRVEQAIERTNDLIKANNRAYTRWSQEFDEVRQIEIERYVRREFYKGQLDILTTGKYNGMDVPAPVQTLVINPETNLVSLESTPPTGRPPETYKGQPLRIRQFYLAGLKQAGEDILRIQDEIKDLVAKHNKSTVIINGDAMVKGLRKRIVEQEQINQDAVAEALFLEDAITNRRAQAQLFVKRRDALQARVEELEVFFKIKDRSPR